MQEAHATGDIFQMVEPADMAYTRTSRLLQRNTDKFGGAPPALYPGCNARVLRVLGPYVS